MSYDYVKRVYGVNPVVGQSVLHQVTQRTGTIAPENRSMSHYVQVRFVGKARPMPCHPTELDYLDQQREARREPDVSAL